MASSFPLISLFMPSVRASNITCSRWQAARDTVEAPDPITAQSCSIPNSFTMAIVWQDNRCQRSHNYNVQQSHLSLSKPTGDHCLFSGKITSIVGILLTNMDMDISTSVNMEWELKCSRKKSIGHDVTMASVPVKQTFYLPTGQSL